MARYTGPITKKSRRLKVDLVGGDKNFDLRPFPPGQHGRRRTKIQAYGIQLREKQKVKRMYGVLERQFRTYFATAARRKGITGSNLLQLLELRLDNVVYRLGFASSRSMARQLIAHGHILVNGRKLDIPSAITREGSVITLREKSRTTEDIRICLDTAQGRGMPAWLELDPENFRGVVKQQPTREDITMPIQEQLIVELYSK